MGRLADRAAAAEAGGRREQNTVGDLSRDQVATALDRQLQESKAAKLQAEAAGGPPSETAAEDSEETRCVAPSRPPCSARLAAFFAPLPLQRLACAAHTRLPCLLG